MSAQAAAAALAPTGLPRLVSALATYSWRRSMPQRLLVCADGLEAGIVELPADVDVFELGGCAIVEAAAPTHCCGSSHLFSAGRPGGTLLARLHRDGVPLELLSHQPRPDLAALPEQGRLRLLGLVGGEVADSLGMPRPRRLLLWGGLDGRPLAWSRVPRLGGTVWRALKAGSEGAFWFHHPAAAGELERRLQLDRRRPTLWLDVSSEAADRVLVERLAAPALAVLGEEL